MNRSHVRFLRDATRSVIHSEEELRIARSTRDELMRYLRRYQGWTPSQLALHSNLTVQTVHKILKKGPASEEQAEG